MLRRPVRRIRAGRPGRRLASALLPAALLLAGCSAAPTGGTPASTTSNAPAATSAATTAQTPDSTATGAVDAADAVVGRSGTYSVVPPDGWGEATEQAGQVAGVDLVLLSSEKVAGFNTNFVVHVGAGDVATLDAEMAKGRDEMSAAGRDVSDAPAVTVAGVPAAGFTASFTDQGVDVVARAHGLHRNGRVFLLTLSSSPSAATQAAAELEAILESWTWTEK